MINPSEAIDDVISGACLLYITTYAAFGREQRDEAYRYVIGTLRKTADVMETSLNTYQAEEQQCRR